MHRSKIHHSSMAEPVRRNGVPQSLSSTILYDPTHHGFAHRQPASGKPQLMWRMFSKEPPPDLFNILMQLRQQLDRVGYLKRLSCFGLSSRETEPCCILR